MRVAFPDCTPYMAQFLDAEARALVPALDATPRAIEGVLPEAEALLLFHTRLDRARLAAAPRLRAAVFLSTGVSSWIDLDEAARRGIAVRRVVGYADRTVAEHAIALIFDAVRRTAQMDREVRAGTWQPRALYELAGKTLGIIGLGGIGRETARLGSALGLRVIGWNRSPVPPDLPCELLPLEAVLQGSDIVSLHLGLNEATRGFFSRERLALLKPGAILINTARGTLVDEAALIEQLAARRIAAAGLDVFADEPLPHGHALMRLPNVTLTAHAAWMSPEAGRRLLLFGLRELRDVLDQLQGKGEFETG